VTDRASARVVEVRDHLRPVLIAGLAGCAAAGVVTLKVRSSCCTGIPVAVPRSRSVGVAQVGRSAVEAVASNVARNRVACR
jgi:hypothetical protein